MKTQSSVAEMSLLEMQTRLAKVKEAMALFFVDGKAWDLLDQERMSLEAKIEAWGTQSGIQYRIM